MARTAKAAIPRTGVTNATNVRLPRECLDGGTDLQKISYPVDPALATNFLAIRNPIKRGTQLFDHHVREHSFMNRIAVTCKGLSVSIGLKRGIQLGMNRLPGIASDGTESAVHFRPCVVHHGTYRIEIFLLALFDSPSTPGCLGDHTRTAELTMSQRRWRLRILAEPRLHLSDRRQIRVPREYSAPAAGQWS